MEVKTVLSKSGKTVYFLVDENGNINEDVFSYMCFLYKNNKSKNTVKNYCFRLKIYFDWLELNNYNYMEIVKPVSNAQDGILDYFADFKLWLQFPDIRKGITKTDGYEAQREARTVNQIMDTVFCFYDYLLAKLGKDALPVYQKVRDNSQTGNFLSEMITDKKETKRSLFKIREKDTVPDYITIEEYELCYQNATNRRNRVIVGLLFEGALRVSEVINLKLEDLKDLYKNQIHIVLHNDVENRDAAVKYLSEGTIHISDRLRDEIISYINETHTVIDSNYLVINLYGDTKYQPMTRDNIEDMIERLGNKVGIEKLHPHALRHSCAVNMLDNHVDLVIIKDFLRHKNIHTTEKIYAKLSNKGKVEAAKRYNESINKSFTPTEYANNFNELLSFMKEMEKED